MIKPSAVKQGMAVFKQSRPLPPAKPAAQVSFLTTDRVSSQEAATETRNRERPHLLRQADQGPQRSTATWTLMLWTGWRESQGARGPRGSRVRAAEQLVPLLQEQLAIGPLGPAAFGFWWCKVPVHRAEELLRLLVGPVWVDEQRQQAQSTEEERQVGQVQAAGQRGPVLEAHPPHVVGEDHAAVKHVHHQPLVHLPEQRVRPAGLWGQSRRRQLRASRGSGAALPPRPPLTGAGSTRPVRSEGSPCCLLGGQLALQSHQSQPFFQSHYNLFLFTLGLHMSKYAS